MRRLHIIAGFVVLVAWLSTVLDGMLTGDYHGLDLTTPVMLALMGYLGGDALFRKRGNGDGGS